MAKQTRSNDWGFPRWRAYGSTREAKPVRLCDRVGCSEVGDRPAPKAPNSPERWMFCETHAAEYNRGWDYFAGLSKEEAEAREADAQRDASGYRQSSHHAWGGAGDGSRSREEVRAMGVLGLEPHEDFEAAKRAWRQLAKDSHPDLHPGDTDAAKRFQAVQTAFEVLRAAEERRAT